MSETRDTSNNIKSSLQSNPSVISDKTPGTELEISRLADAKPPRKDSEYSTSFIELSFVPEINYTTSSEGEKKGILFEELYSKKIIEDKVDAEIQRAGGSAKLALEKRLKNIATLSEHDCRELLLTHITEKCISYYVCARSCASKFEYLSLLQSIMSQKRRKLNEHKRDDQAQISLLDIQLADISSCLTALGSLTKDALNSGFDDEKSLETLKTTYGYLSNKATAILTALEKFSPTPRTLGPVQSFFSSDMGDFFHSYDTLYAREKPSYLVSILAERIKQEYKVPQDTETSSSECILYTSGMAAINSAFRGIETFYLKNNIPVSFFIVEGFYFEAVDIIDSARIHVNRVSPSETLFTNLEEQLNSTSNEALIYFAQPFSSGPDRNNFDIEKFLQTINTSNSSKDVSLVIDSTMIGAINPKYWAIVSEINAKGGNLTIVTIESLIKHGQQGLDSRGGGISLAYGSSAFIPAVGELKTMGNMMRDLDAAYFLPFDAGIQQQRISRAGRNASMMYEALKEDPTVKAVFPRIFYASSPENLSSTESETKAPFLFLEFDNFYASFGDNEILSVIKFYSTFNLDTKLDEGTSYGFDHTRVEVFNIGNKNYLRLSAGQETAVEIKQIIESISSALSSDVLFENLMRKFYLLKEDLDRIDHKDNEDQDQSDEQDNVDLDTLLNNYSTSNSPRTKDFILYYKQAIRASGLLNTYYKLNTLKTKVADNPQILARMDLIQADLDSLKTIPPLELKQKYQLLIISTPQFLELYKSRLISTSNFINMDDTYNKARSAILESTNITEVESVIDEVLQTNPINGILFIPDLSLIK